MNQKNNFRNKYYKMITIKSGGAAILPLQLILNWYKTNPEEESCARLYKIVEDYIRDKYNWVDYTLNTKTKSVILACKNADQTYSELKI